MLRKILSYLWPQTDRVSSRHSGTLEITTYWGRKVLDSKNANYSYGSLQRILETGLKHIDLSSVQSVLLLGLGGGSVVVSLRETFGYEGNIHAVEIDPKVIEIAAAAFGITPSENLSIECRDASEFVAQCATRFDLIIVDIFIDNRVPLPFLSPDFCQNLQSCLGEQGTILFNLGLDEAEQSEARKVITFFEHQPDCTITVLESVDETNTLGIIQKNLVSTR